MKGVKRAGSPAVSESSGNESTRKTKQPKTSAPKGSRAGTPLATGKRKAQGAGSGSDGEATAGEMSDGAGPKKKIKLKSGSGKGTPAGSRAGSPNPPNASKSREAFGLGINPYTLQVQELGRPLAEARSAVPKYLRTFHQRVFPLRISASVLRTVLERALASCLTASSLASSNRSAPMRTRS